MPRWVDNYLDKLGSVLKKGGWRDREVDEMVEVAASGMFDGEEAPPAVDAEAVLDTLLLKTDRCSESLRRAGRGHGHGHRELVVGTMGSGSSGALKVFNDTRCQT
ncbi:unnamed protein product [Triticum turgidum subsp. durum]|uniref:Uncharacterized protein n=1 Tax=Triticum turgidum subsp. durum TaxID=4567 RepID=A0A9R0Y6K8_TRITD|nr:unnamed protein product [Triticum turgidum subsp. durum]